MVRTIAAAAGASQTSSAADGGDPAQASQFESTQQDVARSRTAAQTASEPASQQTSEQFQLGATTRQTLARYGGHDLRVDEGSKRDFGSQEAATAYARSLGTPAALVEENGRHAVYLIPAERSFFQGDFSRQNTARAEHSNATNLQSGHSGLRRLVTADDFVVRTDRGAGVLRPIGSPMGPFSPHIQAFGSGLERVDDHGRFEHQFEQAMQDIAFEALDNSQRAAQEIRDRLNGNDLIPQDRPALERAMEQLQPLERQIAARQKQVDEAYWMFVASSYAVGDGALKWALDAQSKAYDALKQRQAEFAEIRAQRAVAARDFPLVLHIDNLDQFRRMDHRDQIVALRAAADGVLKDIATTRSNIGNGQFNLWMMDGVRNATAARLGVQGERLRRVEDRATGERRTDAAWKIGETAFTIGLAVGGGVLSGGVGLILLGASTALGLQGAIRTTEEYLQTSAAANTDLDPNAGLIPQDLKGGLGWVAASWIGLGLDATAVVAGIKAWQAGARLSQVAKGLNVDTKVLQAATEEAEISGLATRIVSAADFTARFGIDSAQGTTLLRVANSGRIEVEFVTRADLSQAERRAALAEEFTHLQQLNDPAMRNKMLKLSEENLAGWHEMSPTQRLDLYRTKFEVEADAQRLLIAHSPAGRTQAQDSLEAIEKKLAEIDRTTGADGTPDWLPDAPPSRLFSKKKTSGVPEKQSGAATADQTAKPLNADASVPPQTVDEVQAGYGSTAWQTVQAASNAEKTAASLGELVQAREYLDVVSKFKTMADDEVQNFYLQMEKMGVDYRKLIGNAMIKYGLTADEAHAIFGYTTKLFYRDLNETLAAGGSPEADALVKLIEAGLSKMPKSAPVQYRGWRLESPQKLAEFDERFRVGETVTSNFWATAPDEGNAYTAERILVIGTTEGRDISDLSFGVNFHHPVGKKPYSAETLIPPGIKFTITRMDEKGRILLEQE